MMPNGDIVCFGATLEDVERKGEGAGIIVDHATLRWTHAPDPPPEHYDWFPDMGGLGEVLNAGGN
jgi:hypothetical protein